MRDNLKHAMRIVDGEADDALSAVIADNYRLNAEYVAHEREVAAKVEEQDPAQPERTVGDMDAELRAAAAEAALRRSQALADANTAVARALVRGGHDATNWPPAAALAAENIATLLLSVQDAAKLAPTDAFKATSSPGDIARGAAVGAVLNTNPLTA